MHSLPSNRGLVLCQVGAGGAAAAPKKKVKEPAPTFLDPKRSNTIGRFSPLMHRPLTP
jgi:hypothetical protein